MKEIDFIHYLKKSENCLDDLYRLGYLDGLRKRYYKNNLDNSMFTLYEKKINNNQSDQQIIGFIHGLIGIPPTAKKGTQKIE